MPILVSDETLTIGQIVDLTNAKPMSDGERNLQEVGRFQVLRESNLEEYINQPEVKKLTDREREFIINYWLPPNHKFYLISLD